MRYLNKLKNPYTTLATAMLIMLGIALLPLLYLGQYAHPCTDDFSYGYYPHALWSTTHSFSQTLKWNFIQVRSTYDTWQGTFSSAFFMGISPAVWGEEYYFLTPIIMLAMIIFPHFYLLHVIMVKYLKVAKSLWGTVSCITVFLMIETIISPFEGLYWFNGAVHYVFMHGCMILLFGLILQLNLANKRPKIAVLTLLACLLAVVCGGANYSTALLGFLGTLSLCIATFLYNRKQFFSLFPIATYAFAFYKSASAPGNAARQSFWEKQAPVEAIWNSILQFFESTSTWISLPILLFMLLLIPVLWQMAKTATYRFKMPVLITILSAGSVACMFTPSFYAMGISGPGRLLNIVKIWFLFLLILNEGYWIGYLHQKFATKISITKPDVRLYAIGILMLVLLCFIIRTDSRLFDYSSYAAYVSIRAGEAESYHQEYLERLDVLENSEEHVYLKPFSVKPRLLFLDDISTDTYDWRNTAMARWYGKESVTLIHTNTEN